MKNYVITAFILAFLSSNTFAINEDFMPRAKKSTMRMSTRDAGKPRDHVIDHYRQERIKHEDSFYNKCKNKEFETFYLQEKCIKSAGHEYRTTYPDRGTHEYGEKFYSSLSPEQGRQKRDELLNKLDRVSFNPKPGNDEIELTVDHIRKEMHYIERYVMRINPRHYETW